MTDNITAQDVKNQHKCPQCGKVGGSFFAGLCIDCASKKIEWKKDMQRVFDEAIKKAESRLKEKGYVEKPWIDWPGDLRDRLHKEIGEWRHEVVYGDSKAAEQSELKDIINCAAFQYLRLEAE